MLFHKRKPLKILFLNNENIQNCFLKFKNFYYFWTTKTFQNYFLKNVKLEEKIYIAFWQPIKNAFWTTKIFQIIFWITKIFQNYFEQQTLLNCFLKHQKRSNLFLKEPNNLFIQKKIPSKRAPPRNPSKMSHLTDFLSIILPLSTTIQFKFSSLFYVDLRLLLETINIKKYFMVCLLSIKIIMHTYPFLT